MPSRFQCGIEFRKFAQPLLEVALKSEAHRLREIPYSPEELREMESKLDSATNALGRIAQSCGATLPPDKVEKISGEIQMAKQHARKNMHAGVFVSSLGSLGMMREWIDDVAARVSDDVRANLACGYLVQEAIRRAFSGLGLLEMVKPREKLTPDESSKLHYWSTSAEGFAIETMTACGLDRSRRYDVLESTFNLREASKAALAGDAPMVESQLRKFLDRFTRNFE